MLKKYRASSLYALQWIIILLLHLMICFSFLSLQINYWCTQVLGLLSPAAGQTECQGTRVARHSLEKSRRWGEAGFTGEGVAWVNPEMTASHWVDALELTPVLGWWELKHCPCGMLTFPGCTESDVITKQCSPVLPACSHLPTRWAWWAMKTITETLPTISRHLASLLRGWGFCSLGSKCYIF